MRYDNQAKRIRTEVLVRVAKAFLGERPEWDIDHLAIEMRPKDGDSSSGCVYKDREILKYLAVAALGFGLDDETDELTPLRDYYRRALERKAVENVRLTVVDIACSSCMKSHCLATSACRGCLGRACQTNCPKDAIKMVNGRAKIIPEKCVNCGLCIKACPYNAIVRTTVPCEEICPVRAVLKDENDKVTIDYGKCISCGQCTRACPFAAIQERSQLLDVLKALRSDRRVVAMIAPAIVGQFPGDLGQIVTALDRLGFDAVKEVAVGADEVARLEAEEWHDRIQAGSPFMTASCCSAYIEAVKKHLPDLAKFVSHTPSPMAVSARHVKEADCEAVTVFIGPCHAKRTEAFSNPNIDYVLTYEEMGALLIAAGIDVQECASTPFAEPAHAEGRGFPVSGGVVGAIRAHLGEEKAALLKPVVFDGLDRKAMGRLKNAVTRGCEGNLVEVMGCEGGCLGGPSVLCNPAVAARKLTEVLAESKKENKP